VADDFDILVPAAVLVAFPDKSAGAARDAVRVSFVTLKSLKLTEYGDTKGFDGTKALHSTATFDGTNGDALDILATQIATDWYRWQLARVDVSYSGVVDWTPAGFEDVEWSHVGGGNGIATRVARTPYLDHLEELLQATPTTTTLAPCTGYCLWGWDNTAKAWSQTSSTCSAGCQCVPPTWCGGDDCETTKTNCAVNPAATTPAPFNCGGTSTTPVPTTTTTLAPGITTTACPTTTPGPGGVGCGGPCQWKCTYFGWTLTQGCGPLCGCEKVPEGPCGECGGGFSSNCVAPVVPPPFCGGDCDYVCDGAGGWILARGGCVASGTSCCSCSPPSVPCTVCNAIAKAECGCPTTAAPTTTAAPPRPCDPTTTTLTPTTTTCAPGGCCGWCKWKSDGTGWTIIDSSGCTGCACSPPPYDGSPCEVYLSPCVPPTTTTSTTPPPTTTTTSTTEAPCGTCDWQGSSGFPGTWSNLGNNCTGDCFCVQPGTLSTAGQMTQTQCAPTTTCAPGCSGSVAYWSCGNGGTAWNGAVDSYCGGCTADPPPLPCLDGSVQQTCCYPTTTTTTTPCPATTTQGPGACGTCSYQWGSNSNFWKLFGVACSSGCICGSAPSDPPCPLPVATEGGPSYAFQNTNCVPTTTAAPTTTSSTTTTGAPQYYCWQCVVFESTSYSCATANPGGCAQVGGPYADSLCGDNCPPTTTTAAPATSSTTAGPCTGSCFWEWDGSTWQPTSNDCSASCGPCVFTGGPGINPGDTAMTGCA